MTRTKALLYASLASIATVGVWGVAILDGLVAVVAPEMNRAPLNSNQLAVVRQLKPRREKTGKWLISSDWIIHTIISSFGPR